jgi:hypothetical protein
MADRSVVLAVEDLVLEAIGQRLIREYCPHLVVSHAIVTQGSGSLRLRLPAFIRSAHAVPFVLFTDLDSTACPVDLIHDWAPNGLPAGLLLRVAVREAESWLMADKERLSDYLRVPANHIPDRPEEIWNTKQAFVNVARRASKRIRESIVPAQGAQTPVGPEYTTELVNFIVTRWRPERARQSAPSLNRTIERLKAFWT